jgi:probable HAF family extracellular repeat protein
MNAKCASRLIAALVVAFALAEARAEILYRVRPLPWLPNHFPPNFPQALSDTQQIAGYSATYDEWGQLVLIGYRLDLNAGSYVVLEIIPGIGTTPTAMANSGAVVGLDSSGACGPEAWLWTEASGTTVLGDLSGGSCSTHVEAVNNQFAAVGRAQSSNGEEAFLWTPDEGMIGLGDLPGGCFSSAAYDVNDSLWIVGVGCTATDFGAPFLWTPQLGLVPLDDVIDAPPWAFALAINNENEIAGSFPFSAGRGRPYVWNPDTGTTILPWLTDDPTESSGVVALSDRTHVLGEARTTGELEYVDTPFIWDPRHGMRGVEESMDPCRPGYQRLVGVIDVNADGWILARIGIQNPNTEHGSVVLIPYIPGDLDDNEMCDLQDLAILLGNFSRTGDAAYEDGDLDCDQDVDLQDLAVLLSNFGESLP